MGQITPSHVVSLLIKKIIDHEWTAGEKLPSENALAQELNLPRASVRSAYQILQEMGYLKSSQGVGHFLRDRKPRVDIVLQDSEASSFTDNMQAQGIPLENVLLSARPYPVPEEDRVLPKDREPLYEIARLRLLYDIPAAIHYSYLAQETFPTIAEDGPDIRSVFSYFRSKGHTKLGFPEGTVINVAFPTLEESQTLKCGSLVPLLIRRTTCFDMETGQPIEWSKTLYRTDVFEYRLS